MNLLAVDYSAMATTQVTAAQATAPDYTEFWLKVKKNWGRISAAIYNLTDARPEQLRIVLSLINSFLGPLAANINIDFTIGEINRQQFENSTQQIELYISPKLNHANIIHMDGLYDSYHSAKIALANCMVARYSAWHASDERIATIQYDNFTASYDDFVYQSTVGYYGKIPRLNIIIVVKQPLADHILKKETVQFKADDGKQSAREVYLPKHNTVDLILLNCMGEYAYLNLIGYIELLPSDHPLVKENPEFHEMASIADDIQMIMKAIVNNGLDTRHEYNTCNWCSRYGYQTRLYRCSRCVRNQKPDTVFYCSATCARFDMPNHNQVCCSVKPAQ